jgi:hypothetical protein
MTSADLLRQHQARNRAPRERAPLALPLALMALLIAAAVGFIASALWPRGTSSPDVAPDPPALPVTVAGVAFNVPPAAVRVPVQRRSGAHERIDLAFLWPSLALPDADANAVISTPGPRAKQVRERVFVTITAAADTLAPQERVATIYARYVEVTPAIGADGLAVLAFRDGSPYQGEDLIYDAVAPAHFVMRCSRDRDSTPGTCLYNRRIGAADLVVRLPRAWLSDWKAVADRISELIERLTPGRSPSPAG